jgi:hypothetical protein
MARLQHANSAVVMSAVKVTMGYAYLELVTNSDTPCVLWQGDATHRCADATRWRRCDQERCGGSLYSQVPCCCPRDMQLAAERNTAGAARSHTGTKQLTKSQHRRRFGFAQEYVL